MAAGAGRGRLVRRWLRRSSLRSPRSGRGPVWTLAGLRTGQCVRFLLDPAVARRALHDVARLVPANRDETLHPALRSVIDGQPEFATWSRLLSVSLLRRCPHARRAPLRR